MTPVRTSFVFAVAAAIGIFATGGVLHAASISWTAGPTSVTSTTDIDTSGTLVHAGTWGGNGSQSVVLASETIPFVARPLASSDGSAGYFQAGGTVVATEYAHSTVYSGSTGSAPFDAVMDGFGYAGPPGRIEIGGLTVGKAYQVQLFQSDDRSCCNTRQILFSDNVTVGAGNETATFLHGSSAYVMGQFTADATTQDVYAHHPTGSVSGLINGYVLRNIASKATVINTSNGLQMNRVLSGDPTAVNTTTFSTYDNNGNNIQASYVTVTNSALLAALEVDLGPLGGGQSYQINSATFIAGTVTDDYSQTGNVYTTSSYSPATINWNNQPETGGVPTGTLLSPGTVSKTSTTWDVLGGVDTFNDTRLFWDPTNSTSAATYSAVTNAGLRLVLDAEIVPEPSTLVLLAFGLLGLLATGRRRR